MSLRRPWPWPGDTPTERARKIAAGYRELALRQDPEAVARLDEQATVYGEGWIVPPLALAQLDDEITVEHAGQLVGRSPSAIYNWIRRDSRLTARRLPDGGLRVRAGDVLDVDAELRQRRAIGRHTH